MHTYKYMNYIVITFPLSFIKHFFLCTQFSLIFHFVFLFCTVNVLYAEGFFAFFPFDSKECFFQYIILYHNVVMSMHTESDTESIIWISFKHKINHWNKKKNVRTFAFVAFRGEKLKRNQSAQQR